MMYACECGFVVNRLQIQRHDECEAYEREYDTDYVFAYIYMYILYAQRHI